MQNLINGPKIIRNTAFNFAGEFVVLCFGAVCVPYVIRRLGTESFGVLSLAWVLLAYMTLFDLGLSRATTKFAAEALGRGADIELPTLLGNSVTLQLVLGAVAGLLLFLLSPWVAKSVLKIPTPLIGQATASFQILALAVPIVLITNCLRGMLEALQRFDLINYVKVPANASMFLSPLVLIPFHAGLPSIILLMTVFRIGAMAVYLIFCFSLLPKPGIRIGFQSVFLKQLLTFGGWITVSNVTGPILMYLDRFAIGALLSIGAVSYYTAPADMINRALIVPAGLCTTLFPAFSSLNVAGEKEKLEAFYVRSMKYLIMGLGPMLLVVAAFSHDILQYWLGASFAKQSTLPLQILALGVFINSLGYFPYSLLQGLGRPDLTGIFHLIELPIHVLVVAVLVSRLGIIGAALSSTLRLLLDTVLLFIACGCLRLMPSDSLRGRKVLQSSVIVLLFGSALGITATTPLAFAARIAIAGSLLLCYSIAQWHWACDPVEQEFLRNITRKADRYARTDAAEDVLTP